MKMLNVIVSLCIFFGSGCAMRSDDSAPISKKAFPAANRLNARSRAMLLEHLRMAELEIREMPKGLPAAYRARLSHALNEKEKADAEVLEAFDHWLQLYYNHVAEKKAEMRRALNADNFKQDHRRAK